MNRSRTWSWLRARPGKKALRPFARWRRLFLEPLEERVLLTATWKNPAGGDWSVPSNWTSGTVPGVNDDVVIDVPSALVTITHSSGTDTVKSLVSNENLTLSGGSLTVTTTVQVAGTFTLSGGTLAGATVVTGTTLKGTTSGGTLSNVTLQGNLDLTGAANVRVNVSGGPLTLSNATVSLGDGGGNYGLLIFSDDAAALAGSGSVVFANGFQGVYNTLQENASGGTLTIGPGVTVHGGSGSVGYNANWGGFANVSVVNQGTIAADGPGTLTVNGTNWTSSGALRASGGTLALSGTWSSTGTLGESGATLNLGGSFTTAGLNLASFTRSGGAVNLTGTLNNSGSVLPLSAATGSWSLLGGTVSGGTVSVSGGAALVGTNLGGTLSGGVTLLGDPSLSLPQALDLRCARS